MRVIAAYTDLDPRADAALREYAPGAERHLTAYCDLPPDCGSPHCKVPYRHCHHQRCDTAYGYLLERLWHDGETFLIVEHDIGIHARVVPETAACGEAWCAWPYPGAGWSGPGDAMLRQALGCTKFHAELMAAEPDAMTAACSMTEGLPPGDWRRMDVSILPTLRDRGYAAHAHTPAVKHFHQYPIEGAADT